MKLSSENSPMTREEIQRILDSPIPYTKQSCENEIKQCKALVETLTPEEVELAAQSSYAYWLASISDEPPSDEERTRMALREARRHLFKVTYEMACTQMKETCIFRKERRIDLLRSCFLKGMDFDSEADAKEAARLGSLIAKDLEAQESFVRGADKEGRAVMVAKSRVGESPEDESFVATQLFMMERAIACTESLSVGSKEKIMVVADFAEFSASRSPSWNATKELAAYFQHRYPERLSTLVIIDPPFWMRTTYGCLKPFLDPATKKKFILVSGDDEKQEALSELIDEDQAMPFMLPTGKLHDPVDVDRFVQLVPFHCCYDDVRSLPVAA